MQAISLPPLEDQPMEIIPSLN